MWLVLVEGKSHLGFKSPHGVAERSFFLVHQASQPDQILDLREKVHPQK